MTRFTYTSELLQALFGISIGTAPQDCPVRLPWLEAPHARPAPPNVPPHKGLKGETCLFVFGAQVGSRGSPAAFGNTSSRGKGTLWEHPKISPTPPRWVERKTRRGSSLSLIYR